MYQREDHEGHRRRSLAQGVNAAVDGFCTPGCTAVTVKGDHGAGYTIPLDMANSNARYTQSAARPFRLPCLDTSCDATGIAGPLRLTSPAPFHEVREQADSDPQAPPTDSRVIDEYTRVFEGEDVLEITCTIDTGYPPHRQPCASMRTECR